MLPARKKMLQIAISRVLWIAVSLIIQIAFFLIAWYAFSSYSAWIYAASLILSLIVVLKIINDNSDPSMKLAWIIPILLVPVLGGVCYLLLGMNKSMPATKKFVKRNATLTKENTTPHPDILVEVKLISPSVSRQMSYIEKYADCPPYKNSKVKYFPSGEAKFKALKDELEKAEHYIFLEYFIIMEGTFWDAILEILVRKVKSGVDVRLIYDDAGSLFTLPYKYFREMESLGIKCRAFNQFVPFLSVIMNNRDHRKIVVIDGHTAFTGGINLSDEYINEVKRFGYWKDTAVMIKGDAVWSFTVMFLSLWDSMTDVLDDFDKYRPDLHQKAHNYEDGYVQPYTDSPLDGEPVGETVYLNIINRATKYVYITTPYLIVDGEMMTALENASKSGVDVRIITPGIPDKKLIYALTRSYYAPLIEAGVKIYEYTPGFIHAKNFVSDDEIAVVGTINLDYRSLYLHFECASLMFRCKCIEHIKSDYFDTLEKSHLVTMKDTKRFGILSGVISAVMRLFAPML